LQRTGDWATVVFSKIPIKKDEETHISPSHLVFLFPILVKLVVNLLLISSRADQVFLREAGDYFSYTRKKPEDTGYFYLI